MRFDRYIPTAEQQQFADEVRRFVGEHITEEVHAHERRTGDGFNEAVHLALGAKGWIMPRWPVSDGGAGLDDIEVRLLDLALAQAQLPMITMGTTRMVWAAVERYLDPELVAEIKPQVASGQVRFCLGYTEPDGGSDIAAAKVRAIRDGDEWTINGSKIFTTGAHNCQYCFLITRTDPEKPKHKGLTMFLVPLDSPGIEIQAVHTYGGERTNIVYYGDVRVSDRYRLGDVDQGWTVLRGPLDAEHNIGGEASLLDDVAGGRPYLRPLERALDGVVAWYGENHPDANVDRALVAQRLGQIVIDMEAAQGTPGPLGRVACAEALVDNTPILMDIVGPAALIPHGQPGAIADGELEYAHRFARGTKTYGGTVEVFRNIIAQHVLGLPRPDYRNTPVGPTRSSG